MQTLTLEITGTSAMQVLKNLASRKEIKIIAKSEMNSPALPGEPLSLQALKKWVISAEAAPTISLTAAKSEWANRKKRLQHPDK